MYETIKMKRLFEGNNFAPIMRAIIDFDEKSIEFSEKYFLFEKILRKIMKRDPRQRPSSLQILEKLKVKE